MIYERIENFLEGLINLTRQKLLKWEPLTTFSGYKELDLELDSYSGIDFMMNSINREKSYYLKHKDGFVFLFYIYHGDPSVTSPELDALALMVKANSIVPIYNLTGSMNSKVHQQKLETLRLLVEHYLEEKYSMPDTLYKFMAQVLSVSDNKDFDFGEEDAKKE